MPGAILDDWEAGTPSSYSISGTITEDAAGLSGVLVTASGGFGGSATTNGSGVYSIPGVPAGATAIVLTPTLAGHSMSPLTRTVAGPVTANVTGEDFTSTVSNGPAADDFNRANETPLVVGGNWQRAVVGGGGTVNLTNQHVVGTTGDALYYWQGSGTFDNARQFARATVIDAGGQVGLVLLGGSNQALITAWNAGTGLLYIYWYSGGTNQGALTTTASTLNNGDIIEAVLDGGVISAKINGFVVASVPNTTTLTSGRPGFEMFQAGAILDDWEAGITPSYSISGTITENAAGLSGVLVTASGGFGGSATTNGSGVYSIPGVPAGATAIVLTPTLAGYTMNPLTRTVAGPVTANVTGENFTSTIQVACNDGIDNDGDTLIDLADPGCASAADPSELTDADLDGLLDLDELALGTDPFDADSDDDGLLDGFEVASGFNPLAGGEQGQDPDVDGLTNLQEQTAGTNPHSADSDGDGLRDGFEVANGFNPLAGGEQGQDPDVDGLTNLQEQTAGTHPNNADTDGDGLKDGFEVANGFNPNAGGEQSQDPDGDGLSNLAEQSHGTNPNAADTDGDSFSDGTEVSFGTNPLDAGLYPVLISLLDVGASGNADDVTGFGGVPSTYTISPTEITNRQYVAFLNAVARTADPAGLFSVSGDPAYGITRTGSPGSHQYAAVPGREELPVNFVSVYDAMRFVNWLVNGQPVGVEGPGTTETGTYTITSGGVAANSIARNPGTLFALPNEDEWYKAAYFDPGSAVYFAAPAFSNGPITCAVPGSTPDTANCGDAVGDLTAVGAYTASASPNGTFDQGGNVWEWTEEIAGVNRRIRGGAFDSAPGDLEASASGLDDDPLDESADVGFRVIPEPDAALSLVAGTAALLGLARRASQRRRSR